MAAIGLIVMLDIALAQAVQDWVLNVYGGSVAVACGYVALGQVVAIAIAALAGALVASGRRRAVAGIALLAGGAAFGTWVAVNYVAVAIWAPGVDATNYFLVQAYAAAYLFPLGVPYYWFATAITFAIWFAVFLNLLAPDLPLAYKLAAVKVPKTKRRRYR